MTTRDAAIRNAAPPEKTGDDVFDYWIEKRACRKRSQKDDESIIRKHLRPAFGKMRLRDIGVEEVDLAQGNLLANGIR